MRRLVLDLRDERPVWALPDWVAEEVRSALARLPASMDDPHGPRSAEGSPTGRAGEPWEVVLPAASTSGAGDGVAGVAGEVLSAVADAEAYVGFGIPPEVLEAGSGLRWVHSAAAGVGSSLGPLMRRRLEEGLRFTNSAGIHGPPVAETVVAAVLHFARGLDFAARSTVRGEWDPEPFFRADTPVGEVAGTVAAIVGYGGIGREVGRRLEALGVEVVGIRSGATGEERERALARADWVVLTAPHTPATEGMMDGETIGRLKEGAVLLNVSRGALVEEEALAEALRAGRLRGAYLDVASEEPLPEGHLLWGAPGLLVTPHTSAVSRRYWRRETDLLLENLARYLRGEPLLNPVDPERGY